MERWGQTEGCKILVHLVVGGIDEVTVEAVIRCAHP